MKKDKRNQKLGGENQQKTGTCGKFVFSSMVLKVQNKKEEELITIIAILFIISNSLSIHVKDY